MRKLLPILAFLLFGCSKKTVETDSYSEPAYSKQYRSDALTVIISLSETNIPSAGKITAMLEVHTPDEKEPSLPNLGNFIDPFTVANGYTEPAQTLANGKTLHRRVWVLVPGLPGNTIFQPLEIQTGNEEITTEAIPVTVASLIPSNSADLTLRDIADPIDLLPEQQKKRRSIYTSVGVLLTLALIPVILLRVKKAKLESCILPHEEAFQSLENLPADSVERIHKLNRIFRSYQEACFGVPMVGKTAVELSEVLDDTDIIHFLETCDEVRFSNKVPEGFSTEAEQFVRTHVKESMEISA